MSDFIELKTYFNEELVHELGLSIQEVHSDFDLQRFKNKCLPFDSNLGLKDRSKKIKDALIDGLPANFMKAGKIILNSFRKEFKKPEEVNWFTFMYFPISDYIEEKGCELNYLPLSFQLVEQLTIKFTAEFCIRKFII